VLRHLPRLYKILWNLVDSIREEKPDALLLIDYPGFNLKLAKKAKSHGVPVMMFNGPQIWAWRKKRLQQVIECIDKLVVLFPFELELYANTRVEVNFFGHPLVKEPQTLTDLQIFRDTLLTDPGNKLVTLAPGSRPSEIRQHLPVILETVKQGEFKNVEFVLPLADGLNFQTVEIQLSGLPIRVIKGQFEQCIEASDAAIVASGTASLQAGLAIVPYVLIYRVSPISFWIAKRLALVPFLGILNLLAKKQVVKELLQNDFTPENLIRELKSILENDSSNEIIKNEMRKVRGLLGDSGAYARASEGYLSYLSRTRPQLLE
jgi:lipid-A-disaccharide synthase